MTSNNENRVVVTGMGAVTCLGNSVEEFWTGLKKGQSGIREISLVSPDGFPCKVSGEIQNFDAETIITSGAAAAFADKKLNVNLRTRTPANVAVEKIFYRLCIKVVRFIGIIAALATDSK